MEYRRVAPYSRSSRIYDTLMADVDYTGFCDYLLDLADCFDFRTGSLFDLSCGTATFLNLFPAELKYGMDLSSSMIRMAKKLHPALSLSVGNMLMPPARDVDIYLNIHDALNYIRPFEAIIRHLRYMDTILRPAQVYLFDFAMPGVIRDYFDDTGYEDTSPEGISFRRQNRYDPQNKRAITDLFISHPHGQAYHERHIQYIYEFAEIMKLSVEIPSRRFIFLEEFTCSVALETSNRILVIMR
ncbi:MAG: class I SAM-dependent methyltransferase [Candidatus Neomarinimicrobiota bacterium]|jgi:SAM-dependent methyltransferase|nr:class I SAM-dependent methyltransferase [Candidatus Neomarinimicrobiota bacterium]MDX9780608.1 class I SAM-dependent methyltransferase [bacterium]